MIIPIRCFTCGKLIANKWVEYEDLTKDSDVDKKNVLNKLGFKRYCCIRMFISHVDLINIITK